MRVLVITWGPGGNLPPMLGAAECLARRGHEVAAMGSGHTRGAFEGRGFQATGFLRSPDPDVGIAFEAQAAEVMAMTAGLDLALDARDAIEEVRPDLIVADCMLPGAQAAGQATGTPTASIVHFLYGLARRRMVESGDGWTTDLRTLASTRRALGLAVFDEGLAAWEAPELVLVTAPEWLDVDAGPPDHVVHAGPLGVEARPDGGGGAGTRALLTFSTTVMEGQPELVERVCKAVADLGLRPTLTLGPALAPESIGIPDEVEIRSRPPDARVLGRHLTRRPWNRPARPCSRGSAAAAAARTRSGVQREPRRGSRGGNRTAGDFAGGPHPSGDPNIAR
jgi:UDP:flavonoid glycosyltransferase YjiC (YdhE family)